MGDFKFEVWPTEYRQITQHFGVNPRNYAQFGLPGHDGVDIRAPSGSKVFCVAPGEVFRIHDRPTGHNYGIHVRVAHQDGYQTIYGHMQEVLVKVGQIVEAGTLLGLADNTGNSFGSHLHIGLKKEGAKVGNWPYNLIDPTPYLLPLLGWKEPDGPYAEGWVLTASVVVQDRLAQVNAGGATLYINADQSVLIPEGTMLILLKTIEPFVQVRVARAAVGLDTSAPVKPAPEPPPIISTVDGWALTEYLRAAGKQAVVGDHGINLRSGPDRSASNIGLVKAGSTVSVMGSPQGDYLPIRVRRNDLQDPVALPEPPPDRTELPPKDAYLGWVLTQYLTPLEADQAITSRLGVNLRSKPDPSGRNIGLVKAFATVRLAGRTRKEYTPILASRRDVLHGADPMPDVEAPDPLPADPRPSPSTQPAQDTTPGWSFTNGLSINGSEAIVARYGSNLRAAPRRDAKKLGFIPPGTKIIVTGPAQGEYTPVRVDDRLLEAPTKGDEQDPDPQILGRARIGLHASTDPNISDAEHHEFASLRPGIIKVLSFHKAADVRRLASSCPDAHWVVRAYLSFAGRRISPAQFVGETIGDVRRTLDELRGRQVVVELGNAPNLASEGLGSSWSDGASYNTWFLELLDKYRQMLPETRFIYPGLAPGSTVTGVKLDHVQFIEASRPAVEAADGLGVHIYWSRVLTMREALAVLDDYISRFRFTRLWITEASYNAPLPSGRIAQEYLQFWREIQKRPVVQGVTYFVASTSDPQYAAQTWVGKGIGTLVGKR